MEATLDFAYSDFGGQIVKKALWKAVRAGVKDSKATASRTFGYEKQRNRATAKETGCLGFVCVYMFCWVQILESICIPVETVYWEGETHWCKSYRKFFSIWEKTGSRAEVKDLTLHRTGTMHPLQGENVSWQVYMQAIW